MEKWLTYATSEKKVYYTKNQRSVERFFAHKPESFNSAFGGETFIRKSNLRRVALGVYEYAPQEEA